MAKKKVKKSEIDIYIEENYRFDEEKDRWVMKHCLIDKKELPPSFYEDLKKARQGLNKPLIKSRKKAKVVKPPIEDVEEIISEDSIFKDL